MTMTIELNSEQRRAAHAPIGPTLVSAGPGSGKTRVAIARVEWLINSLGVPPERITVYTFTNRAARELRQRLSEALPEGGAQRLFAGTFHSWGARFLRRHSALASLNPNFTICDQQESNALLRQAMTRIEMPERGRAETLNWLRRDISRWKSDGKSPEQELIRWRSTLNRPMASIPRRARELLAYQEYQRLLTELNSVDFEDLIAMPLRILTENPDVLRATQESLHHIIVDEYQDTSRNQHRLVTTLADREESQRCSIFIVGDTDQAIYSFRNADIRNLNQFSEEYPSAREIYLENNYRSSEEITDAAQSLIEANRMRLSRVSRSVRGPDCPLVWQERDSPEDEAEFIAAEISQLLAAGQCQPEEICIAYRTNPQSRPIEEALSRAGLLYQVAGNFEFYRRTEIRRYLDYLKVVRNPLNAAALERIINLPNRHIGDKTMTRIMEYAREQDIHLSTAIQELAQEPTDANASKLPRRAREGLVQLRRLLDRLTDMNRRDQPVADLVMFLSEEVGLKDHFARQRDGHQRVPNIMELEQLAREHQSSDLQAFLDRAATNRDAHDHSDGRVTVSSIHQTKGLEFERVYITGVEEGLLPHSRSGDNPASLEEERRLMYVAMTRARRHVTISWCRRRAAEGRKRDVRRSRFVDEIPGRYWRETPS